jgi:hypothetical protein
MIVERVWFPRLLISFIVVLFCSCHTADHTVQNVFFTLEGDGTFLRSEGFPDMSDAVMVPWPRQTRVTDIISLHGKTLLAVNGRGIAQALITDKTVSIETHYHPAYFSHRTVTRFFPYRDELYCHVYVDTAFPGGHPDPVSPPRFGLVKITEDGSTLGYDARPLLFQQSEEPWEVVGAGYLDPDRLVLEWKLTEPHRSLFRYSTFHLGSGAEEEKTREWFYANVSIEPVTAASNTVIAALIYAAEKRLTDATPGCVILVTLTDPLQAGDRRLLVSDEKAPGQQVSAYYNVALMAVHEGYAMLLADGSYFLARSPDRSDWEEGRFPEPPSRCRYTGLGVGDDYLCASWEQIDFYKVGRAGMVFHKRVGPPAGR